MNIWTLFPARASFILLIAAAEPTFAHDAITTNITWTQEISRIVQKRCNRCHAVGSDIPLSNYEEARPWAKAIRDQVLSRKMPPWGAVKGVGDFRNDPGLTPLEIELFTHWVEGGAPKGDEIFLPKATFTVAPVRQQPCATSLSLVAGHQTARGTFGAVQPVGLPAGASLEASAELPGGEVRRLIWIRDFPSLHTAPYIFRQPLILPAGSRVFIDAPPGVRLLLCR